MCHIVKAEDCTAIAAITWKSKPALQPDGSQIPRITNDELKTFSLNVSQLANSDVQIAHQRYLGLISTMVATGSHRKPLAVRIALLRNDDQRSVKPREKGARFSEYTCMIG